MPASSQPADGPADTSVASLHASPLTRTGERLAAERRITDARLRRLFDANVVGIFISANDGIIIEANDAFLTMIGYTREELEAGLIDWRRLTPPEWLPRDEAAIEQLERDGIFQQFEKEYIRKDGTRLPISIGGARIERDGEQICYIIDLSEIRRAQAALSKSEERYGILADALPQVVMLSDEQRRIHYVNRFYESYTGISAAEVMAGWPNVIHPDDLPHIARARATGEDYDIEYRLRRADGVYRWHYARCMRIPSDDPRFRWLATAIDIDDRKRAEDALRFIENASSRLSQSLDSETTFATILDLVVPEFGDWATITVRDDAGRITTVAARHRDPEVDRRIKALRGTQYHRSEHSWGTAAVFRTGEPQLVYNVSYEDMVEAVQEPYVDLFRAMGFGTLIALPIVYDGEVIGSLGIRSTAERLAYTPADLAPLNELARRAGFAIANARRFEREHHVASVLQQAALPETLPNIPGLGFDAFYQAGRTEALIGGDWYDAYTISGGRVVISVGDVAGNGLDAAVLMGNVRQVLRAAAHLTPDPLMMLEIADRTLRSEHAHAMVTAFIGVIDLATMTMRYSSAGHWPALVRNADGTVTELEADGLPLGCRDLGLGERRTATLAPGSRLVLYTDGLVEWARDARAGEARLRACIAQAGVLDGPRPAKALVDRVLGTNGAQDDIAVLTVSAG